MQEPRNYTVYTLACPFTRRVRYVGITGNRPTRRLTEHIRDAKLGRDNPNCAWIRRLLAKGAKPIFRILERTNDYEREVYWVMKYKKWHRLNNVVAGGVGSKKFELLEATG